MSYAVVSTNNMELTPMRVTYNGVDLGGTLGNVLISMKYTKAEIKADQSGTTIRDRRVSGLEITVTTELAEVNNKDLWKVLFPHATEISTGTKAIDFKENMGDSDLANAHELKLHPLSRADATVAYDFTFFKATASAESEYNAGPTEQSKMKIVWNILPDDSVTPNKFMRFGDPALV